MTLSRLTTWTCCAIGAIVLGTLTGPAFGQAPAGQAPAAQGRGGRGPAAPPLIDAQHLRMQADAPDPHATTTVFGSQSSEGYYIVRQHFAAHQTSRPHYHDKDRWVTVLSGTWYTGEGDVFKPETMVPLKPGSIMYHPANMHHYDGSMDDQEVLLQIVGYGPVSTVQTEVDDKGNPVTRAGRGRGAAPAGDASAPGPGGR